MRISAARRRARRGRPAGCRNETLSGAGRTSKWLGVTERRAVEEATKDTTK